MERRPYVNTKQDNWSREHFVEPRPVHRAHSPTKLNHAGHFPDYNYQQMPNSRPKHRQSQNSLDHNYQHVPKSGPKQRPYEAKESNLYEWGKWRTVINQNIIKDVMQTGSNMEYASLERVTKTSDGYKHDRTGGRIIGDPRYVMGYSLSTNQVTDLSPEEFLAFGIPRAKVKLNHSDSRDKVNKSSQQRGQSSKERFPQHNSADGRGQMSSTQYPQNHHTGWDQRTNNNLEREMYPQKRSRSPDTRQYPRSPDGRHSPRSRSPDTRQYPRSPDGRHSPRSRSPDTRQYNQRSTGDKEEQDYSSSDSKWKDKSQPEPTPRVDYIEEEVKQPLSVLERMLQNYQGEHKPVRVLPESQVPPAPPPPPPPPPLPPLPKN